jgi:hypothetical protein
MRRRRADPPFAETPLPPGEGGPFGSAQGKLRPGEGRVINASAARGAVVQLAMTLILFLVASSAFAHAGHMHTYMGTVTMLHGDNAFMIKTTDGKDVTIETSPKTEYTTGDGHAAKKSDVTVGTRVVVKMEMDGKTAASVKVGGR